MASQATREPVKVIFIDTYYVEVDRASFKSIVQRLTGKISPTQEKITEGRPPYGTTVRCESSSIPGKVVAAAAQDGGIVESAMHTEVVYGDLGTDWSTLELPEDEKLGWLFTNL